MKERISAYISGDMFYITRGGCAVARVNIAHFKNHAQVFAMNNVIQLIDNELNRGWYWEFDEDGKMITDERALEIY